jgi:hypothetical protein
MGLKIGVKINSGNLAFHFAKLFNPIHKILTEDAIGIKHVYKNNNGYLFDPFGVVPFTIQFSINI